MEKAIQRAIEGGWINKPALKMVTARMPLPNDIVTLNCVFTDPLFWRALGKAEGWKEDAESPFTDMYGNPRQEWQFQQHRFIDHLQNWKDAESFFTSLLK